MREGTAPRVLIVGAGPPGLTVALELARYGVALRIVDQAHQCTDRSRGTGGPSSRSNSDRLRGSSPLRAHAERMDPLLRAPLKPGGVWLVRPDGVVACVVHDAQIVPRSIPPVWSHALAPGV